MIVVSLYDMMKDSDESVILNFKCTFFLLGQSALQGSSRNSFFPFPSFSVILGSENFFLVFGYHTLTLTCFSGCIAFCQIIFIFLLVLCRGMGHYLQQGPMMDKQEFGEQMVRFLSTIA